MYNQALIHSWNQPVLSNQGGYFLKQTKKALGGVWTHSWQASFDYESLWQHHAALKSEL